MFYIDNDSGVTVMPPVSAQRSAIVRWFSEGDGNNVITWPGMDWFNIVQAELLNTLEEAGIQPDKTKLNQLALSIKAIMNKNALLIKNNLSEIKTAGASAQRTARENLDIWDASLNKKGLVQLTSATDSPSETLAATAKAVKIAMDNANARLAKDRNGADIPNKPLFIQNLGLGETAKQAAGAVQKTGDEMSGKLTLPQTSSFGVNTNNTLGGSSIAIGDNDTGLKGNGDGNLAFMANNVLAGYFNENELQHSKKMLTKNFQALVDNNWPEGAGGFSGQLSSEAPFSVPMVHRQNNDNNFFPLLKGKVSLESGYPLAASFGILTSGNTNFPQIAIHAKTDFDVNDKIWVFDVATGEFRAPGRITATEILLSGKSRVGPDGNLYGDVWGGWLNDFLINNYNRKNTASLGDYGWVRDESTGFIMQWGTLGSSNGTYNFPREFPASCFAVFVTNTSQQGGAVDNAFGYPVSKSQFFAATKASTDGNVVNNYPVAWFAIGR
ncbi:tail fiber protein [Salmonella enterica]|nr:tail fiber protein [Salmonella enterica]